MTWQVVSVVLIFSCVVVAGMCLMGYLGNLYTERYKADVQKHISNNDLEIAKIPRSIFGSGLASGKIDTGEDC